MVVIVPAQAWGGALRAALRADADATDPFVEPLRRALRLLSPDHATAWADALRYAIAGKRAGAFARSRLCQAVQGEWRRRLDFGAPPPPALPSSAPPPAPAAAPNGSSSGSSWALAAKWLVVAPAVLAELGDSRDDAARRAAVAVADGLRAPLLDAAGHNFQAVRDRIGQSLAACYAVGRRVLFASFYAPCGTSRLSARTWLISPRMQVREAPEDVQRLAAMLDDADEDAKRRKRETAYGLLRHASRAGKVSIVAPLIDAAIDGCADAKQDHQALAAQSVGTLMASPALRLDAAPILGDRLMRGASHAKWRSRRAAAAALGAYAAARACLGDAAECTKVAQALSALLGDDTSEVRDAATGSFSVMAVIAAPAQRDAFCQAQLDRAKAALPIRRPPKRKKTAVVDVSGAQRLGAVTALGACVLAYPYDVPAHVPASLVALARHSHTTSSSNGGARHAAAVREAVRATFAEFKRTHAETWDFVRPLFSSEELDALADILSAGDYLV